MGLLKGRGRLVDGENVKELKRQGLSEEGAVRKMVSLKRTAKEKKGDSPIAANSSSSEDYPYETRMTLDHDLLDKLGMTSLPAVGTEMKIHARAKVHSTSEHNDSDGESRRSIGLQMTHMRVK